MSPSINFPLKKLDAWSIAPTNCIVLTLEVKKLLDVKRSPGAQVDVLDVKIPRRGL
jgi:hypothetical protein